MPVSCSAPGCTKRYEKGSDISFFRFPKDLDRLKKWQVAMKRVCLSDKKKLWEPSVHDRICSEHFLGGKPSTIPDHPDYVPSVFKFTPARKKTPERVHRFERSSKRCLPLTQITEELVNLSEGPSDRDTAASALLDLGVNLPKTRNAGTDPEPDELLQKFENLQKEHSHLQQEYQRLLGENNELKEEIRNNKFTYTNLKSSQIRAYTGLPSAAVFLWVLGLVNTFFKKIGKLSAGDQLLLVLMKLRLNLTNHDLAYRFKICPTQVSKILSQCIPVLSNRLRFLIKWPSKEKVLKNMPMSFKRNYKKCRVIIDCSEIFIQRPSNLDARAKTWSNYKHHNTLKFLVGITPYGAISFLSKCWGGRVSDKELTLKSGFYDKLEYGDLVLADRGFLIAEELAFQGASLAIPPFAKGKKQFSQKEVEMARRLSRSRIHVERAIERIKNFNILKHTLPISLIKHADHILEICGSLTNLMPKLVK